MTDSRLPYFAFGAVLLAVATYILASAGDLPPQVATHFGARGMPDAWMSRYGYTVYMLAFGVAFPLFIAAAIGALPRVFPDRVSLPYRDYWLAPERRGATLAYLAAHACWLGCGTSLMAAAFHWLLLRASRLAPPRLEIDLFLAILVASLVLLAVWILALVLRFRRPRA
jgi:hypothetical protein